MSIRRVNEPGACYVPTRSSGFFYDAKRRRREIGTLDWPLQENYTRIAARKHRLRNWPSPHRALLHFGLSPYGVMRSWMQDRWLSTVSNKSTSRMCNYSLLADPNATNHMQLHKYIFFSLFFFSKFNILWTLLITNNKIQNPRKI